MSSRLAGLAGLALLAMSLSPAALAQGVVTQPDWLRRPSGEDMAQVYPKLDQVLELEGRAVVSCDVSAAGLLERCSVVSESPTGLGFGGAALALTPTFRMRPQTRDGQPVAGGTVRIPINFKLPNDPPETVPPAKPVDAAKLALGRDLVDRLGVLEQVRSELDAQATSTAEAKNPGVTAEDGAAAAAALRAAIAVNAPTMRESFARAVSEAMDQPDLAALTAVAGAPGAALWLPTPGRDALEEALAMEFWRRLAPPARAAFCVQHRCDIDQKAFAPSAQEPIWQPVWADEPSEATIAQAAPVILRLLNVEGRVKIRCRVTRLGVLEACQSVAEAPAGLGLRAIAFRLADTYRLSPSQAGSGAAGQLLPLEFRFPALEPEWSYTPGKTPSAKARAAAMAYLKAADVDPEDAVQAGLGPVLAKPPEGADPAVFAQAVEAVRKGFAQAVVETQTMRADAYARMFSIEQLNSAATFAASPTGATLRAKAEEIQARLTNAMAPIAAAITRDARTTFCKGRPCGVAQSSDASSAPSTLTP